MAIIWSSPNDATSDADGGWGYTNIPIDNTKTYRSTVWIKRMGSNATGNIYLGADGANTTNLDGSPNTNPYFFSFGASNLQVGRWYLLVGYIHGSGDTSTTHYAGVYDGVTGQKILSGTDYKNRGATNFQTHRTYNYYDTNTSTVQYFYGPRFEEINGNEPNIETLLAVSKSATQDTQSYFG
jgi:hypothetical protein